MCGINGFNFTDERRIREMVHSTRHRGPDDEGVYVGDGISLGHNRLAILDTSPAGHQPMRRTDGHCVIVYNGEIYNFKSLRADLERKGISFSTGTDTEVILAGFELEGPSFFSKLNGIFALAIWDEHTKTLTLARDQLSVKPLYYYWDTTKLIFSSEIKAILTHSAVITTALDYGALNMYFRFLYVPAPHTPWTNIHKLRGGHYIQLHGSELSTTCFWKPDYASTRDSVQRATAKVAELFDNAVERQLISDRPVGLYLSGGIDSTALMGAMKHYHKGEINTYSVGFDVREQSDKYNADFEIARKTAQYYGTVHHETVLRANDVKENFEKVVWHMDDLIANHTQPAMYHLAKLARKEVAVVLSGDGGDELFAGYDRYYFNSLITRFQKLPRVLRENMLSRFIGERILGKDAYAKLNTPEGLARFFLFMEQKQDGVEPFLQRDFSVNNNAHEFFKKEFADTQMSNDSTKRLMAADHKGWLIDDALLRADRMSMAWGIEQRVPLLDKELFEYAITLPSSYNIQSKHNGKRLFKRAVKKYIPDFVYNQPKRGWFSPMAKWLRGDLNNWAHEILSPGYHHESATFINFTAVESILEKHISGERYALNTIWSLITFQVWLKQFYK